MTDMYFDCKNKEKRINIRIHRDITGKMWFGVQYNA